MTAASTVNAPTCYIPNCVLLLFTVTCALNSSVSFGGSFLESPATLPRRMSLTETFLTLNPTLSPGLASSRAVWCISTDFTSVVTFTGANVTIMPAFIVPVSTRPTGTVPIPNNTTTYLVLDWPRQMHRVKYIFYLESIRPIRTAENFEALLGFATLHGRRHSRRSSDVILLK